MIRVRWYDWWYVGPGLFIYIIYCLCKKRKPYIENDSNCFYCESKMGLGWGSVLVKTKIRSFFVDDYYKFPLTKDGWSIKSEE